MVLQAWRVLRLAFGLFLSAHLLACAFAMLELQFMNQIVEGGLPTHFSARQPIPWNDIPTSELYPQVLYIGVDFLVGGAPDSYSGPEAWFCLIGLLIGCTVFSIFFGAIHQLIADQARDSLEHQQKIDNINNQMVRVHVHTHKHTCAQKCVCTRAHI